MARKFMPRISISEWRELGKAAEHLGVLAGVIQDSKWASAPLALVSVKYAYETVAGLYNKAEPAALRTRKGESAKSPGAAPEDDCASAAAAGEPGGRLVEDAPEQ